MQELGVRGFEGFTRPLQSFEFAALDRLAIHPQQALLSIQKLPYVIR